MNRYVKINGKEVFVCAENFEEVKKNKDNMKLLSPGIRKEMTAHSEYPESISEKIFQH